MLLVAVHFSQTLLTKQISWLQTIFRDNYSCWKRRDEQEEGEKREEREEVEKDEKSVCGGSNFNLSLSQICFGNDLESLDGGRTIYFNQRLLAILANSLFQDPEQSGLWLESGVSACQVWEDPGHQDQVLDVGKPWEVREHKDIWRG